MNYLRITENGYLLMMPHLRCTKRCLGLIRESFFVGILLLSIIVGRQNFFVSDPISFLVNLFLRFEMIVILLERGFIPCCLVRDQGWTWFLEREIFSQVMSKLLCLLFLH